MDIHDLKDLRRRAIKLIDAAILARAAFDKARADEEHEGRAERLKAWSYLGRPELDTIVAKAAAIRPLIDDDFFEDDVNEALYSKKKTASPKVARALAILKGLNDTMIEHVLDAVQWQPIELQRGIEAARVARKALSELSREFDTEQFWLLVLEEEVSSLVLDDQ